MKMGINNRAFKSLCKIFEIFDFLYMRKFVGYFPLWSSIFEKHGAIKAIILNSVIYGNKVFCGINNKIMVR